MQLPSACDACLMLPVEKQSLAIDVEHARAECGEPHPEHPVLVHMAGHLLVGVTVTARLPPEVASEHGGGLKVIGRQHVGKRWPLPTANAVIPPVEELAV